MDNFIDPATLTGSEFAKYLAKTAAISLTATTGMLSGMVVVGYAVSKVQDRKLDKKNAKLAPKTEKN